uniref:Synaptonemal complex protein 2 like n=1 Tax=Myripristis murdjan TaxID=586833 RepID=A0A667ZG98_9TELE
MELSVDECWRRGDSSSLVALMYREGLSASLVTRLHRHVTKELHRAGFSGVGVLMKALGIVSERDDDLQLLLTHGLGTKVLLWFETLRGLLTSDLHRDSAPLLSLMEQFYDYFLLLAPASLQAPVSLLLVLLVQLARLVLEPGIIFRLRLEAIRTYNSILESLSREQRRQIQTDTNQCNILDQMAAAVLIVGDYELQVSLSEALCRLTPRKDREQRANQWFCSRDISGAFCNIRDGDFEVDCRRFLNSVNCYRGNERRVYTFPCLRVFLGSTELLRPQDDKLDEFWIDFNLESQRVSFFIDEPEGYLWGAIHLLKQEVNHYSLHCKKNESSEDETILTIHLINPIMHHNSAAQTVEMWFSCEHHSQLEEAAGHVLKSRLTLQNRLSAATEEQAWLPGKPVAIETSADVQTVSSPEILMFEKNPEVCFLIPLKCISLGFLSSSLIRSICHFESIFILFSKIEKRRT